MGAQSPNRGPIMPYDSIPAACSEKCENSAAARTSTRRRIRGFTLTDLVVTCSTILLLIVLMGPTLGRARPIELDTRCEATLHQFGLGLAMYAAEEQGWLPGVNTSGVAIRAKKYLPTTDPGGIHQSDLPVQSFDFMSPLLPYLSVGNPPANRAARWDNLWAMFSCPSQNYVNDFLYGGAAVPDLNDFAPYDFAAVSYLMPTSFSIWGSSHVNDVVGMYEFDSPRQMPIYAQTTSTFFAASSDDYVSRFDEAGPADRKVFAADGTRFLSSDGLLDFDVSIEPLQLGAFSSFGAWRPDANAYGVREGSPNWDGDPVPYGSASGGQNLSLSYRHGPRAAFSGTGDAHDNKGGINAVFFDGHVRRMNDRQSRAIDMWYPTGSIVHEPIGMTTVPYGCEIP